MEPVRHKIVPGIHILPTLKFRIQTSSLYLNFQAKLGKNTFLLNSAPGFIMSGFEFNFLFIKSSVGEIPVVLCGVILYLNKNVFSFSCRLPDPFSDFKSSNKSFCASICNRMIGTGFDMQNAVPFHKTFKFFACKTRSVI